jgi:hypothetical protein
MSNSDLALFLSEEGLFRASLTDEPLFERRKDEFLAHGN